MDTTTDIYAVVDDKLKGRDSGVVRERNQRREGRETEEREKGKRGEGTERGRGTMKDFGKNEKAEKGKSTGVIDVTAEDENIVRCPCGCDEVR